MGSLLPDCKFPYRVPISSLVKHQWYSHQGGYFQAFLCWDELTKASKPSFSISFQQSQCWIYNTSIPDVPPEWKTFLKYITNQPKEDTSEELSTMCPSLSTPNCICGTFMFERIWLRNQISTWRIRTNRDKKNLILTSNLVVVWLTNIKWEPLLPLYCCEAWLILHEMARKSS